MAPSLVLTLEEEGALKVPSPLLEGVAQVTLRAILGFIGVKNKLSLTRGVIVVSLRRRWEGQCQVEYLSQNSNRSAHQRNI